MSLNSQTRQIFTTFERRKMNNVNRTWLNEVTGFVPAVVRQHGVLRVCGLMSFICL